MRFAARLLFFLFASFVFLVFSGKSFAAVQEEVTPPQPTNSFAAPNLEAGVPKNMNTWTQSLMISIMSAISCQVAGVDPTASDKKCLGVDQKTGEIGFVENGGGAVMVVGKLMEDLYTPPARTVDYINSLAGNFGITKTAHAATPCDNPDIDERARQGIGFCVLSPLMELWTVSRNIVYLIFILIFVVIGVGIMLRVKIDPRTVMSIENQIPKIIVGLLMVTFSYAIAGFLIDVMYGSIYLTSSVLLPVDKELYDKDPGFAGKIISSSNPIEAANLIGSEDDKGEFSGMASFIVPPARTLGRALGPLFDNHAGRIVTGTVGGAIFTLGGKAVGDGVSSVLTRFGRGSIKYSGAIGAVIGLILGGIIGITQGDVAVGAITQVFAFLILAIALLWALIRLWFALIAAYIFLLMDIVFAPFWMVAGLLPGSPLTFGSWVRDVIANLAVFPVTITMFVLAKVLFDAFSFSTDPQFIPPLIGSPLAEGDIAAIVALGLLLTLPDVLKITKTVLKTPKINLQGVGQAIGAGTAVPGGVIKSIGAYNEKLPEVGKVAGLRGVVVGTLRGRG